MDDLSYWRLTRDLSVVHAALLICGAAEPTVTAGYVEGTRLDIRPLGYEPTKIALSSALRSGLVTGVIHEETRWERDPFLGHLVEVPSPGTLDVSKSRVDVESLKAWLRDNGKTDGFFFPEPSQKADFEDPSHPRYAPKLAAAIAAWRAMEDPKLYAKTSPKRAMMNWLKENAETYDLKNAAKTRNGSGIEEIAKVANWAPQGGAPTTGH